jgi:S-DNA-T family DNA segregation ATPase FtsK/SpoIIIE
MLAPAERGLCVLGSAGSGRTSLLATVAAQARHSVWVPPHPEQAWDVVADLVDSPPRSGTVVLVDDLDALLARYPADYGQALAERLENVIHAAGPGGAQVVLAAQRLTGTVTRLADLVPRRVLLALSSRAEFLAAGGAAADFSGRLPAGRAVIDGALVQLALPPGPRPHVGRGVPGWDPRDRVTAAVTRSGDARARVHAAASRAGVEAVGVGDALARFDRGELPAVGTVVVGDGEQWQHAWRLWQALRTVHDVLIDADSAADYRLLTGDRALPPYCLTWRGRAWLIRAGGTPARVCVAGATRR